MPSFTDLQNHMDSLIRKGLQGSVFVKPFETGDTPIATLTDATGLLAVPTGYTDVGRLTKDQGANWTRDIETNDTMSLGASQPTRRDITSDVTGLAFTMQESKRAVFELHEGVDLSAVTADAQGNVSWDKPDRPRQDRYRVFVLFKDGEGADSIYFAKWGPSMQVTDRGEQAWNEGNEVQYPVTLTAFNDSTVGTALRTLWAGPVDRITTDMGFTAAV